MIRISTLLACLTPFFLMGENFISTSEWQLTHYVWNMGIAISCDKKPLSFPYRGWKEGTFDHITPGETIWVQSYFVPDFYEKILPQIQVPIVVVISDGDESFPSHFKDSMDIEDFIQNPYILHIFAQNCDYSGPEKDKVSPIPIGIDFHTRSLGSAFGEKGKKSPEEQERILRGILRKLHPTSCRKKRIFIDFHLNDTLGKGHLHRFLDVGETRAEIFEKVRKTGLVEYVEQHRPRHNLWTIKGRYAFTICPPGNGLDTHRIWEDLVLGCIPIIRHSPLDSLYEGLPVVIIDNWEEITEENLTKWLEEYKDAFTNPLYREKLTNRYWINKIGEKGAPYKENTR